MEFLTDFADRNAIRGGTRRQQQPLDRLPVRFIAQLEGLVMHREHELRTGVIGHRERLLGVAVRMYPRVVGADRHDREIHRLRRPDFAKRRIPTLQYGLLIPIIVGVALFWRWPLLRRIIEAAPQSWIVSIQAYRMEGLIFLILFAGGRLPGAFALPAGVGDVIVGLLAPIVGIAYVTWSPRTSPGWLRAWNLLGIADLVVAVATGLLTSPSPVQLLALDRPNELSQRISASYDSGVSSPSFCVAALSVV